MSFIHQPLYPQGKRPSYPLKGRLGGIESRVECFRTELNIMSMSDIISLLF